MSTYSRPQWGSRVLGEAIVTHEAADGLRINGVPVVNVRTVDLFSLLDCADGATHVVLTVYLRLVQGEGAAGAKRRGS